MLSLCRSEFRTLLGESVAITERPASPRVEARRERTRREILEAAWALAGEAGLEALSLREIATRVGMQAPSLYSYYPSKASILDALFADGYRDLDRVLAQAEQTLGPDASRHERVAVPIRAWVTFCQVSPARYRLMFTSAVPGWSPSPEAYAVSVASFERMTDALAGIGITDPAAIDLVTAVSAGLAAQQMANDPTGDRWLRLIDDAVAMLLHHLQPTRAPRAREERP
jgi:AcrR family transcriptional regulator